MERFVDRSGTVGLGDCFVVPPRNDGIWVPTRNDDIRVPPRNDGQRVPSLRACEAIQRKNNRLLRADALAMTIYVYALAMTVNMYRQ